MLPPHFPNDDGLGRSGVTRQGGFGSWGSSSLIRVEWRRIGTEGRRDGGSQQPLVDARPGTCMPSRHRTVSTVTSTHRAAKRVLGSWRRWAVLPPSLRAWTWSGFFLIESWDGMGPSSHDECRTIQRMKGVLDSGIGLESARLSCGVDEEKRCIPMHMHT